jgi:hypothetical protein
LTPESGVPALVQRPYLTPFLYILTVQLYRKEGIQFEVAFDNGAVHIDTKYLLPEIE